MSISGTWTTRHRQFEVTLSSLMNILMESLRQNKDLWRIRLVGSIAISSRLLSEDEKQDKIFFAHNTNRDLCYSGLNVQLIKAFLSSKKKKEIHPVTGAVILSSVSDIKNMMMP
eukprot:CCRYP_006159-RA/>CCRYP_006159-RA protein AED:0.41 eAED:1.00 QI:0/0/0/1/0/0/2/0/113